MAIDPESRDNGHPVLFGRQRVVEMIWSECVPRDGEAVPVVGLFGPRGSGKTAVLDHLAGLCARQGYQPHAPVLDLETHQATDARDLLAWLAMQLRGTLRFPRLALGLIIADGRITVRNVRQTEADIQRTLRGDGGLDRARALAADIAGDLTQGLPKAFLLPVLAALFGRLATRAITSRRMIQLRFHRGMEFYGRALKLVAPGGFPALVALGRLCRQGDEASRATVNRLLCEAFLADLADGYRHGFRPRNCLILLDNVDATARGIALLAALERAGNRSTAPLMVVFTSRSTAPLPVVPGKPATALPRPDTRAGLAAWRLKPAGSRPWLYPVRLRDLDRDTVTELAQQYSPDVARWADFVYSLTRGHPWGVRSTLDTLEATASAGRPLREAQLRTVLDAASPGTGQPLGDRAVRYLLLTDLPRLVQAQLPGCAAALDMVTASAAGLTGGHPLASELAQRLWLDEDDALHPWPRRLLLRYLADHRNPADGAVTAPTWTVTHERLIAVTDPESVAALHYRLAAGRIDPPVDWLTEQFMKITKAGPVTTGDWIADLNAITAAAREHVHHADAAGQRIALLAAATDDPTVPARNTILKLVTARWIWADPLGDPELTLNPVLETGFRDLALRCPPGEQRLIAEAKFYERGGRP